MIEGDVEREKVAVVLDEGNKPRIRQPLAPRKCQALHARADRQGHDAPIVDLFGEGGQVEALDKVTVVEVGRLEAEGLADGLVLGPRRAGWSMPEDVHSVAGPSFAGQHNV